MIDLMVLMVLWVLVFIVILGSLVTLGYAAMAPVLFVLDYFGFTFYPMVIA